MKIIFVTIIAFFLGSIFGYLCREMYIDDESWKKEQLQEIEEQSRENREADRMLELINYKGDDWLDLWLEYMQQQESNRCHPV